MRALVVMAAVAGVLTPLAAGSDPVVSLPGKAWSVLVDWRGLTESKDGGWSDGPSQKWFFKHTNGRYFLSVVIRPAQPGVTAEMYRDDRWARLQSKAPAEQEERLWTEGERAFFEYFLEMPFEGRPLHQKNTHTFLLHDGSRIELHVSAIHFKKKDQAWLDEIQDSLQVIESGG